MFDGCDVGVVQQRLDEFFSTLIEIKVASAKFTDRVEKLLCQSKHGVNASVSEVMKIYRLFNDHISRQLIKKWKLQITNYVFMGCLPNGVEKARLYFGDVLTLPLLQVQKHLSEQELTFTCYSSTGKRLLKKANDATDTRAERRKRTLKKQMKTRGVQSISEDASKIKFIDGFCGNLVNLRRLHQQILGHFEKVLDNLEQCGKLFLMGPGECHHVSLAILEQWSSELWQQIWYQCKVENEELKRKRAEENILVSRTIGMKRTTHRKRQKKVRSLAIADSEPLTKLKQLEYIEQVVRSAICNQLAPLMEIFNQHVAHRERTELRFIACSQRELAKYSSNELVRAQTEKKWNWLNSQDIGSVISIAADLTTQWQEMLSKKCLIVQVGSSSGSALVFDELIVDINSNFYTRFLNLLGE